MNCQHCNGTGRRPVTAEDLKPGMTFYFRHGGTKPSRMLVDVHHGPRRFHAIDADGRSQHWEETLEAFAQAFNDQFTVRGTPINAMYSLTPAFA